MIPNVVQRLSPGGMVPSRLPSEVLAYAGSATSAVAAGTREAAYAGERAVRKAGIPSWLWAVLGLLALLLIGSWIFGSRRGTNTAFNLDEQVRLGTEKATAALAAPHPGFSTKDLRGART